MSKAAADHGRENGQRLDKWLWFARLSKSRTGAAQLIESGKVRINRVRILKPSQIVREGDVLTLSVRAEVRVLKVVALGHRRGPPSEARQLYRALLPAPTSAGDEAKVLGSHGAGPRLGKRAGRLRRQLGGGR
jgi:ribosome-associated heat shock protein Hsp15